MQQLGFESINAMVERHEAEKMELKDFLGGAGALGIKSDRDSLYAAFQGYKRGDTKEFHCFQGRDQASHFLMDIIQAGKRVSAQRREAQQLLSTGIPYEKAGTAGVYRVVREALDKRLKQGVDYAALTSETLGPKDRGR